MRVSCASAVLVLAASSAAAQGFRVDHSAVGGEPERIGVPPCGGGRMFVGAVSGDTITGVPTITSFCEGSSPGRGSTDIPVTLRK